MSDLLRNRDLFKLYRVGYRDALAKERTALVWAHRMSDALNATEEYAGQTRSGRVATVLGIEQVYSPDTDTSDYAQVAWVDGAKPAWEASSNG